MPNSSIQVQGGHCTAPELKSFVISTGKRVCLCTRGGGEGAQGMGWGFDCFSSPWGEALTDHPLPGEGIFEPADSDKD